MQLTVRDVLRFGGLEGSRVVAAHDRLDEPVESITVLEVAESKIATWVMKNEMYITSFYAIRDDIPMQKVVIRSLSNYGCCGLVICHLGMWFDELDPSVVALCEELHLPLIYAKPESSYVEILNPVIEHLMKGEGPAEKGFSNIRDDFLDFIINEEDMYEVLKKIAAEIGCDVSYYDISCECIYSNKSPGTVDWEIGSIKENMNSLLESGTGKGWRMQEYDGVRQLVYLTRTRRSLLGFIVIDAPPDATQDELLELAGTLNVACALLFSRKNKRRDIMAKYIQEYLGDLLVWNFRSDEVALRRGKELGIELVGKNNIIVVNINTLQQTDNRSKSQEISNYVKRNVLPNISELVRYYKKENFALYRSDTILIFVENPRGTLDLVELGARIVELFRSVGGLSVSVGISDRYEQVREIPAAYNQAFQAAILGRAHYGENQVVTGQDIWFYQQVLNMREDERAAEMCTALLAPLEEYDRGNGSNLIETLTALLTYNMNVSLVAEKLYLHRNTLLYRRNKIVEIYGYSPFEMPHMLDFIMAIEILGMRTNTPPDEGA